jgi:hypothetical protein
MHVANALSKQSEGSKVQLIRRKGSLYHCDVSIIQVHARAFKKEGQRKEKMTSCEKLHLRLVSVGAVSYHSLSINSFCQFLLPLI